MTADARQRGAAMAPESGVTDAPRPANVKNKLTSARVVCISNGFQSNYERGFCNGLAAHGVRLTLISSDATDRQGLDVRVRTVNLRGSQDPRRPRWKKVLNQLRYHALLLARAPAYIGTVVHMIGNVEPLFLVGLLEGFWFRLWCRRYVLTVHDLLPHERHTVANFRLCRWAYRIPHALVVHTERMKADLVRRFGVPASKIVTMHHGIEPQAAEAANDENQHAPSPVPTILLFGKIAPYKGVDLLLNALRGTSFPFRLVLAGASPFPDYRAKLLSSIQSHPRQQDIVWHDGYVDENAMSDLFRSADVLVLPYRHIDQSGVLFQALRFGIPIVASRVGSFDEIVTPEVGELAAAGDVSDLGSALERWFARRTSFSRDKIRSIGKTYEWPKTVDALRGTYDLPGQPSHG